MLEESIQLGCVSQDSSLKKSTLREPGMLGAKHAVQILQRHLHQNQNSGKKVSIARCSESVHREVLSTSVSLMSVVFASRNSRKDHVRKPCTKKHAPAKQCGFGENIYKLKNSDKTTFYIRGEAKVMTTPTSKSPEEREFVVDSGASMHQDEQKK